MTIEDVLSLEAIKIANQKLEDIKGDINTKPIVIFGSGKLGKKIVDFLLSKKNNIVAYSDNNETKWDTNIAGIPIIAPEKAAELYGADATFIISIWSPGHSVDKTKKQLLKLGITNIVHATTILQIYPKDLLPHYHFQTPDFFYQHKNELFRVYNLLADEESKKQFIAHIDCRVNLNFEGLPFADVKNQYFPDGIVTLGDHETFLDGGAYDGDTLQDFCNRSNFKFQKYLALEPDPVNYVKLEKRVKSLNNEKVSIYSFAVGSENCTLKFDATGGEGAGISLDGEMEVQCVKIDDYFYDYKPSFLKFDIEGAELSAIIGCKKVIADFTPIIAICIYHKPEDFWEIPFKIVEFNNDYNFFVRTHSLDGFEFVLYAIPK